METKSCYPNREHTSKCTSDTEVSENETVESEKTSLSEACKKKTTTLESENATKKHDMGRKLETSHDAAHDDL